MREESLMLAVTSGLASLVHFALLVGFVIVVAVVVRKHRPDAWLVMLGAAIVELVGTTIHRILAMLGPTMIVRGGGMHDHMSGFFAGLTLFGTCVSVLFWVLLLVGLMKLARPPQTEIPGAPPYR